MGSKPLHYRIYLLTVWQEQKRDESEGVTWRFRLEDARNGEQHFFSDAGTLLSTLEAMASKQDDGA